MQTLSRILEPEVMESPEEAADYNSMDHSTVNRVFVDDLLQALRQLAAQHSRMPDRESLQILDVGTGTALIPIELCRRGQRERVTGIDLSNAMIEVGRRNIAAAGLQDRIGLERLDAKRLPLEPATFDVVISNSIVHHIPNPHDCFSEMVRILRPGGLLFVRDLLRPATAEELERLVAEYAGKENAHQRQMFRDSLHAALSLDEVRAIVRGLGVSSGSVKRTSDRHWTLCWAFDGDKARATGRGV